MTKDQFNDLSIHNQVRIFNSLLLEHRSIKRAAASISMAKSTIQSRFGKNSYSYVDGQYILSEQKKETKSNKNIFSEDIKEESKKEKVIESNNSLMSSKKDISLKSNVKLEKILPGILELLQLKNDLKTIVQKYNKDHNCIDIENDKLEIHDFKGDLKVKSIKIYEQVLDRFNKFMQTNRSYKQQDIISHAIWEFLEKYDK